MAINKVWIEDGCTACGICVEICPDVFRLEDTAVVIEGAKLEENQLCIREAADSCPVEIIKFSED